MGFRNFASSFSSRDLHLFLESSEWEANDASAAAKTEFKSRATPDPDPGSDADGERFSSEQIGIEGDDRCRDGGKSRLGRD
jgi:hypothetical protein